MEKIVEVKRNRLLDLLKGLCILFVIITHFGWTNQERLNWGFAFWIDMAVPIFLLISGYVYANSFKNKNVDNLKNAYAKLWTKSFLRYLVPFLIFIIVECVFLIFNNQTDVINLKFFLTGGIGPGSYYFPLLIQFLIIFPLIFQVIKKKGLFALICLFLLNLFYEIIKVPLNVTAEIYRLLIFRCLFLISIGCYFATHKNFNKKFSLILSIIAWGGVLLL